MTNNKEIVTAANSKIMNAVDDVKLYAAAQTASTNELNKTPIDLRELDPALNNISRKKNGKRKSK